MSRPIPGNTLAAWKKEINTKVPSFRAASLHVWLGEWELAANQEPEKAIRHFQRAQHLSSRASALYGLAAYDTAIALYYQGAYADASAAFYRLLVLKTALPGYDRKACALWYRQAAASLGYHRQRAQAGIPEPTRLDPFCAAAGIANRLKVLGRAYDKTTVLARMHVGGEGSNLKDILQAAKKLGLAAYPVTADDQGLMELPQGAISFVEHDHFISVVKADKQGVSYLCSDCGAWPGGQVNLSWKQWHLLEPSGYVVLCQPGSVEDQAFGMLAKPEAGVKLAYQGALSRLHLSATRQALALFKLLQEHVLLYLSLDQSWNCGGKPPGQHNPTYATSPMDAPVMPLPVPIRTFAPVMPLPVPIRQAPSNSSSPPSVGIMGPTQGARMNMATGEEELSYFDLFVYNPIGPSVSWSRLYDSLRPPHSSDLPSGFGLGWSDPYNIGVFVTSVAQAQQQPLGPNGVQPPFQMQGYYEEENSARVAFTCALPTSSNPHCACSLPLGADFTMVGNYDATNGSTYFTLTFADRSQIITKDAYTGLPNTVDFYPPWKVVDRNSNYDQLNYNTPASGHFPALLSIADSSGNPLLTLNYSSGVLASVSDRYNRSVYYQGANYQASGTYWETTQASQIVTTGTSNPPARWSYGYTVMAYNQAPSEMGVYLNTITVPSPTGTGTSATTINYDPNTNFVSSIVDGNGNSRNYSAVDANHTKVTVEDAHGNVVTSYTLGFDNLMNPTGQTDGTDTNYVWTALYTDPHDPYRPSSITNGNNDTWSYTWDQYGNIQTKTTPRNTKTTWTWSYANFALGELTKCQEGSNLGSAAKSPTTYLYYEPSGLLKNVTYPLPGTMGSTSTVTTSLVYDSLGNTTQVTSPGNNASSSIVTTFNYTTDGSYSQNDAIGQPLTMTTNLGHVSHFRYDARGNPTTYIDALGNETDTTFNLADQTVQKTYPATGQTGTGRAYTLNAYLYTGGPITSISRYDESNNLARQVSYSYGQEGEMLSVSGDAEPLTYGYDAAYRTKSLTDGNSNVTSYSLNTAGYVSQVSFPLNNGAYDTIQYPSYDNIGNPLKRIDGNGVETDYVYNDSESRLTNINYPASSSLDVTLGYDAYSRLDTMSDGTGSTAWNFDDDDDLTSTQVTYTGLSAKTISYTFYPDGSRETMSTPAGSFTYNYDADERLTQLTNPSSESFTWSYLNNDWLSQQQSLNASTAVITTAVATRNAWGLLTELKNLNGSSNTLSDFGGTGSNLMGHDGVGNLKSMLATLTGLSSYSGLTSYTNNSQDELTQEQSARLGGYTNAFGYDAAQNPTTFRGVSQGFNADNQNTANVYDGNGNPTTYNGVSLTFDPENRLTAYGNLMTAGYTGDGLRAWKQTSAGKTYFLYDGITPVCELDSNGNVIAANTFSDKGLLSRHTNSGSVFYTFDPTGNLVQRLDANDTVLGSYAFDTFGNRSSTDSSTDPFSGYGSQAGYYTDWETGLSLLGFRYYDPGAGRFINRDPIGYTGGVNLYNYVSNNPANAYDPTGLDPFKLPSDPGGLGPGWKPIPGHGGGTGPTRWLGPSGNDGLEFHPGKPGKTGKKGESHWHKLRRRPDGKFEKEDKHYFPGQEVDIEPAPQPAPWTERLPSISLPDPDTARKIGGGITVGGILIIIGVVVLSPVGM